MIYSLVNSQGIKPGSIGRAITPPLTRGGEGPRLSFYPSYSDPRTGIFPRGIEEVEPGDIQ